MTKAFFKENLEGISGKISITLVISIENESFHGEAFKSFIELVNQKKEKIEKLVIIDTTYLNRHYDKTLANEKLESPWLRSHKEIINGCEAITEVKSWLDHINSEEYKKTHATLLASYQGDEHGCNVDEKLRDIVLSTAKNFSHKAPLKQTVSYLLEECAGAAVLNGYVTYAGDFNAAIKYTLSKYNTDLKLISYKIKDKKNQILKESPANENKKVINSQGNDYSPTFFSKTIAYMVDHLGLPEERQVEFSTSFLLFCRDFNSNSSDRYADSNQEGFSHGSKPTAYRK
jgi:vacuolar-type H+-ATPase subunit E/Vma4